MNHLDTKRDQSRQTDYSKATIQQVADAAGVSTGTVSRVINNRKGVKESTRKAVQMAMRELNYQPDQAARELSFRQALRIGLHIKGINHFMPYYMLLLEYLVSELQSEGYRLEEIPSNDRNLPAYLTDALVLVGTHDDDPRVAYLQSQNRPFVLVGHYDNVNWVAPDDYDGGWQATQHLLRLGHQDIVHVSGGMLGQSEHERYSGYRDALKTAGLEPQRRFLLDGEFTALGAYRAVRKAYEGGLRFSAVFAASDEMAVGVIAALNDLGLSVPADVSVVGFDDLPEIGAKLTTIRQDIALIARSTVQLLKDALAGAASRHCKLPVQLIVRNTTARRR
jgi:LacI family transcriptional regulator